MTAMPALPELVARTIVVALAWTCAGSFVIAAFVAFVIRATRASATTRHVLWWLVLAAAVIAPIGGVASSLARIEHRAAVPAPAAVRADDAASGLGPVARPRTARDRASTPLAQSGLENARAAVAIAVAYPHAGEALVVLWLAVATGGLAVLGVGLVSLVRIKRAASPLDESVVRRLRRWRHSSRAGRTVSIAVSNDIDVPIAVGFRTPTILLPIGIVENEALAQIADLDQIAMHEYAHLDRFDDWTNLIERAIERVFWFNPVVAFAASRIALDREIACDDWVIAQTGHAHRYATCLWKLVESSRLPARAIFAPGALFTPHQITIRIEQLLDARRNARPRLSPAGALLGMAAFATIVVVQSVRAPAIALDDARVVAAVQPPVPVAAASPIARVRPPRAFPLRLHGVPVDATPEAIARAVATAVARNVHAHVTTSVSRTMTGPASYADEIGIDIASGVAKSVATTVSATVPQAVAAASEGVARAVAANAVADSLGDRCARDGDSAIAGCDMHGRDLRGRDLRGVVWTGTDVHSADLRDANLRGARLTGVDLHDALLDGADFSNARLTGCNLHGASTRGTNFAGVRSLGTELPAGTH